MTVSTPVKATVVGYGLKLSILTVVALLCVSCTNGSSFKTQTSTENKQTKAAPKNGEVESQKENKKKIVTDDPSLKINFDQISAAVSKAKTSSYKIYSVKVGATQRAKRKLFIQKGEKTDRIPIAFSFQILENKNGVTLVDTGFISEKMKAKWKVVDYRNPVAALAALGIAPDRVSNIVITHRHWDHVGGLTLFPKAKVWMPKKEFKTALKKFGSKFPVITSSLENAEKEGRMRWTKRIEEVLPGVVVVRQGLHTRNFQYVVVKNKNGIWVLASDVGGLYENFDGPVASGQTLNPRGSVEALRNIAKLVDNDLSRVVPSHDPEVFERFPQVEPGVALITDN